MKLAILSRNATLYSTRRLVEAATAEPVELLVAGENVDPRLLAEVSTAAHPPRVIGVYRRDDLPPPEPRPE